MKWVKERAVKWVAYLPVRGEVNSIEGEKGGNVYGRRLKREIKGKYTKLEVR